MCQQLRQQRLSIFPPDNLVYQKPYVSDSIITHACQYFPGPTRRTTIKSPTGLYISVNTEDTCDTCSRLHNDDRTTPQGRPSTVSTAALMELVVMVSVRT
eukprot:4427149-Pyramimonas_sp.AAC.1